MIQKLRRRLTLLVIGVLVVVTALIVLSIDAMNRRNITSTANAALDVLAENEGRRPDMRSEPPAKPEEGEEPPEKPDGTSHAPDGKLRDGRPDFGLSGGASALASLSNAYTVRLDADGGVTEWTSDRADLYDDEQIQAFADEALAQNALRGRVGTQYYRLTGEDDGRLLIALDARLEFLSARRALRSSTLAASLACLLLSVGASLLIRKMLRPVPESFERQKQFVWDASHEFKTPLAVISANAELLSREVGPSEYLGYIQSEVKRTDALLGVALPFESTVFEAGRTLETDIPEGVFVRGDEAMLQQLAVILLSNALKYSNEGGTIRLMLSQKGRGATITVFNTGAGIAPENLERIFDRFYREDASHNREVAGNGLGLAIARTIAEAHKGRIRAESHFGQDATFIVTLPG